ncbi:MAG: hypothetical protein JJV98_07565 [Desulfosarcina sp.]|nr:hypothetical protein [Desulfobacterales bacterium]
MKPEGFFRRFQAPIHTILDCLKRRLSSSRWNPQLSTSRQRHWLFALKRKTMAHFGIGIDLLTAFFRLMNMGRIPVSRAI